MQIAAGGPSDPAGIPGPGLALVIQPTGRLAGVRALRRNPVQTGHHRAPARMIDLGLKRESRRFGDQESNCKREHGT